MVGVVVAGLATGGCGGPSSHPQAPSIGEPISVGPDARYRPPASGRAAAAGLPIGGLSCRPATARPVQLVHLEIFARRRVVAIPAGIGIAPPFRRDGAYVRGGRCIYPLRTREPTGLLEVDADAPARLGDLFAIWGQPLTAARVAGFTAADGQRVAVFVAGRRWLGDPRAVPLTRRTVIVVEIDGFVAPHREYRFPPLH